MVSISTREFVMSQTWNIVAGGRRLLLLALLLAVAPAAARAQDQPEEIGGQSKQASPQDLAVQAKAVLTKYCHQCHGQNPNQIAKNLKVLDYAGMVASPRKIVVAKSPETSVMIQRVESKDRPMPPEESPQQPSAAERKVLRDWIAAGAPDFTKKVQVAQAPPPARPEPRPAPPPPPARPENRPAPQAPKSAELAVKARAVLTKYCGECHGQEKPKKKLNVLDRAAMLASPKKILVPGSPDESKLIKRVVADKDMPPDDSPQPSDAERKLLRDWVAAGAPDFAATASLPTPAPAGTAPPRPAPTPAPAAVRSGNLEEELLKQAAETLDFVRQKNWKNVGVLKFRVQRLGEAEPTDNVGPLNEALATRLELALTLANDDKNPVGIIRNASAVADATPNANHLYKNGRVALFNSKYTLGWGPDETLVAPDAFLTGAVRFSPDLRRMGITLLVFGKDVEKVYEQEEFIVNCDPELIVEAGESFLVRGALKGDQAVPPVKAIQAAVALRKEEVVSPLLDQQAPVKLEVRYDGKVVPVRFENGRFLMPEAKEGQKVSFVLRRQAAADDRLAVVLKVNGESTLFRERLPDVQCRKWVLEPGVASLTIDHMQTDIPNDKGDLLPRAVARSRPSEFRYTPEVGTVTLTVFREAKGKEAAREGADDLTALARAGYPKDRANDLATFKELLRKEATPENAAHGLAAPGKDGGEAKDVEFKADPTSVLALTVVCTRP
jgi:mono/diheme cytochrome c family protein